MTEHWSAATPDVEGGVSDGQQQAGEHQQLRSQHVHRERVGQTQGAQRPQILLVRLPYPGIFRGYRN